MFITEFEELEIVLNNNFQCCKWEKSLGFRPEINKIYRVHWSKLKTKKEYRIKYIKVKCDDCGIIFERRIRDLDLNKNYHLCRLCQNKGERNGQYGKPLNDETKMGLKKWMNENGNPFTWESSKQKIKEKNVWLKVAEKNKGKKRTKETKEKMSLGIINAYKTGKLKPGNGWTNVEVKQYKGIDYQGTYELCFLKYLDKISKLDIIERGPVINYKIDNVEHNYFIDYKIKNTNIVFEIKSSYTWKKNEEINIIKKQTAEKLYNYNLIIDNKFNSLEKIDILK